MSSTIKLTASISYHSQLLQEIVTNIDCSAHIKRCNIQCCDGSVGFPFFLLEAVLPILSDWSKDRKCCELDNDINIIIPFATVTELNSLKQLVMSGKCVKEVNGQVLDCITLICPNMKLFKIEYMSRHIQPPINSCGVPKFQNLLGKTNKPQFQNLLGIQTFKPPVDQHFEIDKDEVLCNKLCQSRCYHVVKDWPPELGKQISDEFKLDKVINIKRKLLHHLIVQDRVSQVETMSFIVNGHKFCVDFFAHMIGCSVQLVKKVLKDFLIGTRFYIHGNSGSMKINSAACTAAICWIKVFSECYGQYSPEENVTVLSYWLTKQMLYKMYKEEIEGVHISQSLFYELFNSTFGFNRVDKTLPWIRISKYSTHSVCKICVALNTNRRQCKTEAELQANIDAKNRHRENFGRARRTIEEIKQLALSFPRDHLFLQIDSMDNSKSYLPRYLENSKDQVQKERLPTKITGCTMYNGLYEQNRKILFYLNHDTFENASNMIITIVHKLLLQFVEDHDFLPK